MDDLDLTRGRPPEPPQTSVHVRRATGVHGISNGRSGREDRRSKGELQLQAEGISDGFHQA